MGANEGTHVESEIFVPVGDYALGWIWYGINCRHDKGHKRRRSRSGRLLLINNCPPPPHSLGRQNLSLLRPIYTEEYIAGKTHPNGKLFVSIAAVSGLIFEVLIFFFGKPLLAKMGSYWLLVNSLLTIVLRLWAYYFVPEGNPNWIYFVFFVELFKGMSAGTLQVGKKE